MRVEDVTGIPSALNVVGRLRKLRAHDPDNPIARRLDHVVASFKSPQELNPMHEASRTARYRLLRKAGVREEVGKALVLVVRVVAGERTAENVLAVVDDFKRRTRGRLMEHV